MMSALRGNGVGPLGNKVKEVVCIDWRGPNPDNFENIIYGRFQRTKWVLRAHESFCEWNPHSSKLVVS